MASLSNNSTDETGLSLELLQQIDAFCDRFEAAWVADESPALPDYLNEAPPEIRDQLLRELLAIELEYRRDADGRRMSARAIVQQHPELASNVAEEFGRLATLRADSVPTSPDRGGLFRTLDEAKIDLESSVDLQQGDLHDGSGLHIRCPHCQNQVELLDETPLEEITCRACGSNFTLVEGEEETAAKRDNAKPLKRVGRFELLKLLGMGGFGAVWKAKDTDLDRCVALKIPRSSQLSRTEMELFFREARAAAQLRHPNIVPVHEVGRDGETIFIVSDLIRGRALSEIMKSRRLELRETAGLMQTVAGALEAAHEKGVIHRDLKPSNIMIDELGVPHLMDFGLAKRQFGEITMTVDGQILGTPAYMSPEQAEGAARWIDRRTDIYSLGVMLFQMLTGELPFRGSVHSQIQQRLEDDPPNPKKLNSHIPEDLSTLCLKCLERDPNRRYNTAEEVGKELGCYLAGEPIQARPISRLQRTGRWTKRNPLLATAIGLASLLAIGGPAAAIVINSQNKALVSRLTEVNELISRGDADSSQSAATITELESEQAKLIGANPVVANLPTDWRATLATEYLAKHYASAKQLAEALPKDASLRATTNEGLAKLLIMAGRFEEAAEHLKIARQVWLARLPALEAENREAANNEKRALANGSAKLSQLLTQLEALDQANEYAQEALALREELGETETASLRSRVDLLYSVTDHTRRQTERLATGNAKPGEAAQLAREIAAARQRIEAAWSAEPESISEVAEALQK